jgi:hypothetical protein
MSMSMSMCGVLVVLVGSSAVAPFATGVNSPPQSVALGASDNPHRDPDLRTKLFGSDIPLQIPEDTVKLVGPDRGRRQSGPAPNMTIGGSIMCGNTANGSTIGAQNTIGHATGEHWYSFTAPVTGSVVSPIITWIPCNLTFQPVTRDRRIPCSDAPDVRQYYGWYTRSCFHTEPHCDVIPSLLRFVSPTTLLRPLH